MKIGILLATVYVATSSIDAGLFVNFENKGSNNNLVLKEEIHIIDIYDDRYISICISQFDIYTKETLTDAA